jgi:predicted RNase H-like HicB family nuclease
MSKSRIFTIIVERDPESGWLVGEVAELPGCYTQAPDLPDLEKNVKEAIAAYLSVSKPHKPLIEFVGTFRVGVAA